MRGGRGGGGLIVEWYDKNRRTGSVLVRSLEEPCSATCSLGRMVQAASPRSTDLTRSNAYHLLILGSKRLHLLRLFRQLHPHLQHLHGVDRVAPIVRTGACGSRDDRGIKPTELPGRHGVIEVIDRCGSVFRMRRGNAFSGRLGGRRGGATDLVPALHFLEMLPDCAAHSFFPRKRFLLQTDPADLPATYSRGHHAALLFQ